MYRYFKLSQSICDDDQLEYRYGVVCNTTYIISFSVERIKERIDEQSDVAVWVDIKKIDLAPGGTCLWSGEEHLSALSASPLSPASNIIVSHGTIQKCEKRFLLRSVMIRSHSSITVAMLVV